MRALVTALVLVAAACAPAGQRASPSASPARQTTPDASLATPSSAPSTSTASATAPLQSPVAQAAPITELRSSAARQTAGRDRLEGVAALAAADAGFAFDLYHQLRADNAENLFFSPYSISTALSMQLGGARGNTADQIASVLGVGADEAAWHDARNRLELALSSDEQRRHPGEGEAEPLTLEATNTIFGQADYAFRDQFLDLLAADYGAGMQTVDFSQAPEPARVGINEWVAQRTHDRIEELLLKGSITSLTRAVLVNAIFFKANWLSDFDPKYTLAEPFHLLDGSARDVQMMHGSPETGYANGPGWATVRLPYWGSASMILVVPDEGRFTDIEPNLDALFLAKLDGEFADHEVHLSLPRWETDWHLDLIPALKQLGILDAFDPGLADLSGVADFSQTGEPLVVSGVVHQANITVDEEGTEAAAATAVIDIRVCLCPPPEVTLTIDRPFIYLIRDDVTGEILFLGRLLEP